MSGVLLSVWFCEISCDNAQTHATHMHIHTHARTHTHTYTLGKKAILRMMLLFGKSLTFISYGHVEYETLCVCVLVCSPKGSFTSFTIK